MEMVAKSEPATTNSCSAATNQDPEGLPAGIPEEVKNKQLMFINNLPLFEAEIKMII